MQVGNHSVRRARKHTRVGERFRPSGTAASVRLSHVTEDALPELEADMMALVSAADESSATAPSDVGSTLSSTGNGVVVELAPEPSVVFDVDGSQAAVTIARWEGTVLQVTPQTREMSVQLRSKSGSEPDHTCDISLDEVSPDDLDLVQPGSVFYIEQTRHLRRRTVSFSQSLTFRRLPAWSASVLASVDAAADGLIGRFKEPRLVE